MRSTASGSTSAFRSRSKSLTFRHVHLREVRLHTRPGACGLQVPVQAAFCRCALQTRGQTRGQWCCPASVGLHSGPQELPDQRREPRHRHRCQVHRSGSCHCGSGWIRGWDRDRVREPYHRICQEPVSKAAALLIRHPGVCSV